MGSRTSASTGSHHGPPIAQWPMASAAASLVTRAGSLVRRRDVLAAPGIIGWNVERSFFQRRAGLATLTATTAAGEQHYDVQDVEIGEALRVAEQLLPGLTEPFLERPS